MNRAFLLLPLLSMPTSPPKVISTQRRLFLVLSVLFFCDSLFDLHFLVFVLRFTSDWVFFGAFLQHIPNFSYSFSSCFPSRLSAERNGGGKQNWQTDI